MDCLSGGLKTLGKGMSNEPFQIPERGFLKLRVKAAQEGLDGASHEGNSKPERVRTKLDTFIDAALTLKPGSIHRCGTDTAARLCQTASCCVVSLVRPEK